MANNRSQKVTKYPGNLNNINIGMIFFAVMAIYIIISVVTYLRRDHIVGYQVMEGSLTTNNIYTAVAVRKEKIVESDTAGYINYFATEGGRVAVGNLVYTVDESGQLMDYLKSQGSEDVSLSDNDMAELRTQIVNFDSTFDPHNFNTVYDFKSSLGGTVHKLANNSILSNIQSLNENSSTLQAINYRYAADTGIVVYSIDGYEDLTLDKMNASIFDENTYEKKQLINNELVKSGDPVYKLCTNEEWTVIIMENDEEKVKELEDMEYVKVRFIKNQYEAWGKVSSYTDDEGNTFVGLTFTNSMVTFCRDRFLNIELIAEDEKGLKIPNTSVVNKKFFLVPKEYVIRNNDNSTGVLKTRYDEQGKETTEFIGADIYNETNTEFYIDMDQLRSGDILIKPDSNDRFTLGKTDELIGVYNINKGYADFRQISILYQNDEYSIVKPNTTYGLSVYDYIVLDASSVDKTEGSDEDLSNAGRTESSAEASSSEEKSYDNADEYSTAGYSSGSAEDYSSSEDASSSDAASLASSDNLTE